MDQPTSLLESILGTIIGWGVLLFASVFHGVDFFVGGSRSLPVGTTTDHTGKHLKDKYNVTALMYDFLDYPWELKYREWRPVFVKDMKGTVLELGVGTGRNIPYYNAKEVEKLLAVDISEKMLHEAKTRANGCKLNATQNIQFLLGDATNLEGVVKESSVDWVLSTFLFCVLPDEMQPPALEQIRKSLRIGGKFRLVELKYSDINRWRRFVQWWYSPFVEWMYGARFDRRTLEHVSANRGLQITKTYYVSKLDTHLVIEGERIA